MAKPTIYSHNYQHFRDLQMSSAEFYASLKSLVEFHQYPKVTCDVTAMSTGSIFWPLRDYLRISDRHYCYLVCAAPFGRSFFVSWWLQSHDDPYIKFMQRLPLIGRLFGPYEKSYFEIDTELIFTASVESLIRDAVVKVASDHGYRLPELEETN